MRFRTLPLAGLLLCLVGCGGGDDDEGNLFDVENSGDCSDVYAVGAVVPEGDVFCLDAGDDAGDELTFYGWDTFDCPDDDVLEVNDLAYWFQSDRVVAGATPTGDELVDGWQVEACASAP